MEKTQVPAKKEKMRVLKPALICVLVLTLLCGVIYPLLVTGISQLFFHDQANGSIITVTLKKDLTVTTTDEETGEESTQVYPAGETVAIGSAYIGQEFTSPQYLIGRPTPGAPTNLSPESEEHAQMVQERIDFFHELDPSNTADIPMDLLTVSGSGVDPQISPEAAEYQVSRLARERGMSEEDVHKIIQKHTSGRFLWIFGEPAVNVLLVNLELDGYIA